MNIERKSSVLNPTGDMELDDGLQFDLVEELCNHKTLVCLITAQIVDVEQEAAPGRFHKLIEKGGL